MDTLCLGVQVSHHALGIIDAVDWPSRLGLGDRPTSCHLKKLLGNLKYGQNRGWKCVQRDINRSKIKNGKRGQETELTGRSP
jgi:hypothetical protein